MRNKENGILVCERCGIRLPESSSHNRKYCTACSKIINRQKNKEREARKKQKYCSDPDGWLPLNPDRAYCKPCIYKETHSVNFLCNYFLITGQRRGCKAGVGCEKRKTRGEEI